MLNIKSCALLIASIMVSACASTGRVLVVKSDPADAEVCIKGKAGSENFTNEKNCVGSTPFEADRVVMVDPSGDKRVVKFKDVEGDKESFYVIVSRKGYVSQALEVPEWEHVVTLRPDGTPAPTAGAAPSATPPVNGVRVENLSQGTIKITSEPSGALVYINEILKGNTPFSYEGAAGPLRMKLELTGYVTLEKILTIEAGQTFNLNFRLQSLQSAADVLEKSKPVQAEPIYIEEKKAKSPVKKNTSQPAPDPHKTR